MWTRLIPAIIASNQKELDAMLNRLERKFEWVMLDFMDGSFVPSKSLMFEIKLPPGLEYEAHLMVRHPIEFLPKLQGKVKSVILHVESEDIEQAIKMARKLKFETVIAINPGTPINEVKKHLDRLDRVLIMTVEPGRYGAPFVPQTLVKVNQLRKAFPSISIEVDGAMNPENARAARKAGANIFASGSYILKSTDLEKAIKNLEEAIR